MPTLSGASKEHSFLEPTAPVEDEPFSDACRALVKAAFLIANRPGAPYHKYRLSLAEADVLTTIARAPEEQLNCSEIAEKTLITKSGITKILDRLEARALVRRVPSRDDRRSISIQLTAKGVEFWRRFFPEVASSARELFENAFRPEQMKQFSKLLALLLRGLEADTAKNINSSISPEPKKKQDLNVPIPQ